MKSVAYRKMRSSSASYMSPINGNEQTLGKKKDGDYIPAGVTINFDDNDLHYHPPDIQVRVESD